MRFIRRHTPRTAVLVLAFCLAAGYFGWRHSGLTRGTLAARYDTWRGHYLVLGVGSVPPTYPYIARLLRERYAIEFRWSAVCVDDWAADRQLIEYTEGYNKTSIAAANRRFGRDVFQATIPDAIA